MNITSVSNTTMIAHTLLRKALQCKPKQVQRSSRTVHEVKFNSKGVSLLSIFTCVLKSKIPRRGLNRGFLPRHNGVSTYEQHMNGCIYYIVNVKCWPMASPTFFWIYICAPLKRRGRPLRNRHHGNR